MKSRIFLNRASQINEVLSLELNVTHYLYSVLRMRTGDFLNGFDALGNTYNLRIVEIDSMFSKIVVESIQAAKPDLLEVDLAQSLPRSTKMDLILRQGVEVGVHAFFPLVTRRTVSRPDVESWQGKQKRLEKIIIEACRQCRRNQVPNLNLPIKFLEFLKYFKNYDLVLMPYEHQALDLSATLQHHPTAQKILVLIGPEGGWDPEEIHQAMQLQAEVVHLPTPILRTETAGIVAVSMIFYAYHCLLSQ